MKQNRQVLYAVLISVAVLLVLIYYRVVNNEAARPPEQHTDTVGDQATVPGKTPSKEVTEPAQEQVDALADVVNEQFADEPHIQKGWVSRGQDIVLKNYPGADSADFRKSFFHRGFKGLAVACGEVRLQQDGATIEDYQRYIYVGGQSSHLENDVKNFHILWDKLCVQTYDRN